jgi:predicted RNA-binding Zn-ribbon protein involved in translation (DUF1610 family)
VKGIYFEYLAAMVGIIVTVTAIGANAMLVRRCPKCGARGIVGAVECRKCGTPQGGAGH